MGKEISEALLGEFRRALRLLREAVAAFPADQWRENECDQLIPARQALHIVGALDSYLRPSYVAGIAGGGERFGGGLDWEGSPAAQLPSQADLTAYLADVQAKSVTEIGGLEDAELLAPNGEFKWAGPNRLSRMVYVLGHCQHHQGILHAELQRLGIARPRW